MTRGGKTVTSLVVLENQTRATARSLHARPTTNKKKKEKKKNQTKRFRCPEHEYSAAFLPAKGREIDSAIHILIFLQVYPRYTSEQRNKQHGLFSELCSYNRLRVPHGRYRLDEKEKKPIETLVDVYCHARKVYTFHDIDEKDGALGSSQFTI